MRTSTRRHHDAFLVRFLSRWIMAALLGVATSAHAAAQQRVEEPTLGMRLGVSGQTRAGNFTGYDLVGTWPLPWRWRSESGWHLQMRIAGTAGVLNGAGVQGLVLSAGPAVVIRRERVPIRLEGGSAPAVISEHHFGPRNLGTWFHFISQFSVLAELGPSDVGYRIQHMSNASIDDDNPGVNLHMLEVRLRL